MLEKIIFRYYKNTSVNEKLILENGLYKFTHELTVPFLHLWRSLFCIDDHCIKLRRSAYPRCEYTLNKFRKKELKTICSTNAALNQFMLEQYFSDACICAPQNNHLPDFRNTCIIVTDAINSTTHLQPRICK